MVYGQDFCKKKRRKQDCFCEKTAPCQVSSCQVSSCGMIWRTIPGRCSLKHEKYPCQKRGSYEEEIFDHSLCQEIIKELWALSNFVLKKINQSGSLT